MTITGIPTTSIVNSSFTSYSTGSGNQVEDDDLFGVSSASETSETQETDAQKAQKEAEIAQLQAQLNALNAQKAQLEAEKKQLEAQKKTKASEKAKLDSEIVQNQLLIDKYTNQVLNFNEELTRKQAELNELKKDYDAKTRQVNELNAKLDEQIAQLVEESKLQIEDLRKKIEDAREDAQKKVQSGELKEEEVAQYILNKVGAGSAANNSVKCLAINNLATQIKGYIEESSGLLSSIGVCETEVNKFTAQILSGSAEISDLQAKNDELSKQSSSIGSELSVLNSGIDLINSDISGIDSQITKLTEQLTSLGGSYQAPAVNEQVTTRSSSNSVSNTNIEYTGKPIKPLNNGQKPGYFYGYGQNHNQGNDDYGIESAGDNNYSGETENSVGQTMHNPFISVAYEKVDYTDLIAAMDAMTRRLDVSVETTIAQLNTDADIMRQLRESIVA